MILRKNKKGNTKTSLKKTVLKWFIKLSALVFGFFILIILLIYLGLFGKLPSINDLTKPFIVYISIISCGASVKAEK